ncbi:hypothetical protein CYMTET_36224, partial [Cymbomonas tetramitiformis]
MSSAPDFQRRREQFKGGPSLGSSAATRRREQTQQNIKQRRLDLLRAKRLCLLAPDSENEAVLHIGDAPLKPESTQAEDPEPILEASLSQIIATVEKSPRSLEPLRHLRTKL